jgi:uncharacterized repeat protein (TIGR01451 family)
VARAQDYEQIRIAADGQDGIAFNDDGSTTLDLRYQDLTLKIPESYQIIDGVKQSLDARMVMGERPDEMRYAIVGDLVRDQPLVIDPNVAWSTYFDLNDSTTPFDSYAFAVAANNNGVYVSGWARETITNGSFGGYMEVNAGFSQGTATFQNYIYRLNNSGTHITAWTSTGILANNNTVSNQKLNGAGFDVMADLELFPDGRLLAGFNSGLIQIYSADLATRSYSAEPVTLDSLNAVAIVDNNSFYASGRVAAAIPVAQIPAANIGPDATYAGGALGLEGVIVRYSNATTTPTPNWATYVGGSGDEYFTSIALTPDKTKLVFATSTVVGGAYPALVNAVDSTAAGTTELLVGVLPEQATKPAAFSVFSFLGGSGNEGALAGNTAVALVAATNSFLFVGGNTSSNDLPATAGGLQTSNGGGNFDAFLSRIPLNGSAGTGFQSTYLGGSTEDNIGGIAYDSVQNKLFVYGTTSGSFPTKDTTPASNYFDNTFGGGTDIFLATVSSSLTVLDYSTYVGGTGNDYLGQTGDLIGQGQVYYSPQTDLTYLATTIHSTDLPASVIGTPPGKDTSKSNAGNDSHIVLAFSINSYDYGDAPASYEAGAPAAEAITSLLRIGATVDAESGPASGAGALGDDNNNSGSADDEDGISTLPTLNAGDTSYSVNVSVFNNTGTTRTLHGWIDFNLDGVFQVGEYASISVPTSASQQTVALNWTGFTATTPGQSYLRLRITDAVISDNAGTPAIDERSIFTVSTSRGEVEDIALTINPYPTLSINNVSTTEGVDAFAVFTVSLSRASATNVSFNLALANGTASGTGTDYGTAGAGNLQVSTNGGASWADAASATIAAGQTSLLVRTPIVNDTLYENSESFTLTATATSGNTNNASATGTGTITDNDPLPSFTINDITVNEAAGTATFTVTLSAASGLSATVDYSTSNGTATSGSDYTANSGTLTFSPGVTTRTVVVPILNDALFENGESFNVNLSNPTNATIVDNLGVGTIRDNGTGAGGTDNDTPTLSIQNVSTTEGIDSFAVFMVSLSNLSTTPVTFGLTLNNGTALGAGTDYGTAGIGNLQVSTNGGTTWVDATSATIAAGQTSLLVRTPIVNDTLFESTETFTLTAQVTAGFTTNASASGTGTINNNPPPVAVNDSFTTNEDTPVAIAAKTNDSDGNGDPLTITQVNGMSIVAGGSAIAVTNGTVSLNAAGTLLTFTPAANYYGSASFTYTISDGHGGTSTATISGNVTSVNDPPVADDETFTVVEDGSVIIPVLVGDTDVDGDALTVTQINGSPISVGNPVTIATSTVSLNADGTLTFVPSTNYNGPVSFNYTVSDGFGGTDIGDVSGNVMPTNDPPVAFADSGTTPANATLSGNVLTNDIDPDGDTLVVSAVRDVPANVGVAVSGSNGGLFTISANGSYSFNPTTDFDDLGVGQSRSTSIKYTASDGNGGTSTTTLTITVTGTNNAPTSTVLPDRANDDSDIVNINISSAFSDPDAGDLLTFSALNLPPNLTLNPTTGAITGTLANDASLSSPCLVTIRATDLSGAFTLQSFTWVVTNVVTSPFDDFNTTTENVTATGNVLANDVDPDNDPLIVAAVNGVAGNVSASVAGTQGGSFVIHLDGSYTFDPGVSFNDLAEGEMRSTSIRYTSDDGNGSQVEARLTVIVVGINEAPTSTAVADQSSQDADAVLLDVSSKFSDPDASDVLSFSAMNLPPGLSIDANTGVISGMVHHSASLGSPYSVKITATDPFGAKTSQIFAWGVTNPPPTAANDAFTTAEDTPISGSVAPNDSDPDGDTLTYSLDTPPSHGMLTLNPDGSFTYTLNVNFVGPDTFQYQASDGEGGTAFATVNLTVTAVNDAPTFADSVVTTQEDTDFVFNVSDFPINDVDGDSLAAVRIESLPAHGILLFNGVAVSVNDVIDVADIASGMLIFRPDVNENGTPYTTFDFSVSDGALFAALPSTLTVNVTPVNDAPVANDDFSTTNEDTPIVIDVLNNDTDVDGTLDPTSVIITSTPPGATLAPDGKTLTVPGEGIWTVNAITGAITFTPEANYSGPVTTITYQVADNQGATDTANVSVTIVAFNNAPTSAENTVTTPEDTDFVFSLSDFPYSDIEGDPLTVVRIDSLPADGTLLLDGVAVSANDVIDAADINGGLLVFRPDANENGSPYTTFAFSVSDGNSFSSPSNTLTVNVTPTTVSVVKSLFDSSDPNTVGSNVTIGEELCFALLVTFSEGNSTDFVVTDLLPDGLAYNNFTLITDAASSNGLLSANFNGSVPVPSVSGGMFDGDDVTLTFGAISVAADGNGANNSFVLLVQAFVSDIPSNHEPLANTPVLTNNVLADVSNPQPPVSSNPFDVTVVEPDLSVIIDNGVTTLTAGQSTTYSITITNDGDSVATGIVLSGSLPIDRVSFVSTDDAAHFSIDGSGNFVWTPAIASLAPSNSLTLLLTVQVSNSLAAGITDVTIPVSVTHDNIEPTPANNSANDTDTLDAVPDLRLTKNDFMNSISPGQGSVYTINISNVGTQAATSVLITETVPIGTTFNAALSDPLWTLTAPNTYQISIPTFAAGAGFNVNFAVTINSPAAAGLNDIFNSVTISDDGTNGIDPNPGDNTATDTNTLDAIPDYEITIDDGELVVAPGQLLSYTIHFTNTGSQNGTGVVVIDTFPVAILENVVASDGGIVDSIAGVITWNIGSLAVGESHSFTVTAKVRDTVPAGSDDFSHATSITDDLTNGADPTPGNNGAVDTDTLNATPDYRIAITDGETAVAPGQPLSYTISFLNAGNQDGTGVVVSDTFPIAILENVVASDGGIVDAVAGTITWNVGTLAAGESRSFTVTANVRATIPAGFDDFTHGTTISDDAANGTDPTPADNSDNDTDTLNAQPDYQISIDDAVLSATTGQSLTYSVTFANAGSQGGTGVVVSNSFPLNALTNVVASSGGIVDMTTGTITWNVGSLAPGATLTYTVTADVLGYVAAGINDFTHSTSITDDGANGADPTPVNNSASDTDTLNAAPDLRLTKTDFTNSISPGQGTVYTLNVSNIGTQEATNVLVTETLPVGTTFNPAFSDPAWTSLGGGVYQYAIASLTAGAGFNINFSVLIDNPAAAGQSDIVNTATIADDGTNGPDLDPSNDTATDSNTLDALPNYDIGIDNLQTTVTPGESLTYYVNFNNYGLQNGTGVVISVNFPTAILTNVVASNGGVVDVAAGTITWNVGSLAANDPRTFEITADVVSIIPAGIANVTLTANITDDGANGADPDLGDNTASDADALNAQPDYAITIDDGKTVVSPGDPLIYTINVANNGNQDGTGVVVTVNFPTTLLDNVVASAGGIVDSVAGTITWNLGNLDAGQSTTLAVSTQVRKAITTDASSLTLTATVSDDGANGNDPTPLNNTDPDVNQLQIYFYDSFHDWKNMRVAWLMPHMTTVGRPLMPLPVDPVFSGLTEPGSTLVTRIYDRDGRLLGDRQVVADAGGNWLVTFPNIVIFEQPYRMEIIVTPAINNLAHENGFNLRRYFHPAIHAGLVMTEAPSIAGVFRNRAYNIVEAQHSANTHPLGFQWYSHAYELNAASSNVSQM